MNSNRILKILSSLPVIIIVSYFIPFIGVCLIIAHYFIYNNQKYYHIPLSLVSTGLIIIIPKLLVIINDKWANIPYIKTIYSSGVYPKVLNYSKFLISVGIIFLLLSILFKNLFNKITNYIRTYINKREKIYSEVSQKNDLEIKVKQEKAKNTQVVICPNCGADNILSESIGICKYCRRSLTTKEDH